MATFPRPMASPSFCLKIVTANDLRDGKELPETAVKKYGHCMAESIFLKAPNCWTWWPIKVKRSVRGGRMWLHKGWQDFANFYSLDQGYFALFTYEGEHSHFLVRLFHWNDMEIDYPIHGGGVPKRKRTGANRNTPPAYLEARTSPTSSGSSTDENQNDLSTATSFKSDKPLLMLRMTATYIRCSGAYISPSFAKEHVCRPGTSCNVTLQISEEKVWTAQCTVGENSEHKLYARVSGAGWKAFKEDNHLEVHDVCVFELIEERTFKVSIIRAKVKINKQDGESEDKLMF
ncbi:putative transcription factor B3-Domain family [Rosa chinensis]|uniref:Putative transcription factor B3-Domain family n=1 Tax=Rosa chinensis TaxID=74649 RepID=A0A2P6P2W1_ROSCH|nr:B3 domain-containing protein Os03g0212300 [Rosa chinensis]PRQ16277.1 putative transcription factor B3-Domain family [Rosa chinensis]